MSSTGAHIETEYAEGGEHGSDVSHNCVQDRMRPGKHAGEYERLMQMPVAELTADDVSRLTELRTQAVESGDDTRVEQIDERLGAFVERLDLPTSPSVEPEFEVLEASPPSRGEQVARIVAGFSCGAGIGFVMTGPEGVLAGAVLGCVLVWQVRAAEVTRRD